MARRVRSRDRTAAGAECGGAPAKLRLSPHDDVRAMSDPVDPFEAVKKFWGAFGLPLGTPGAAPGAMSPLSSLGPIPGMVMPTFDVGEIEKRISDLKSVESWLALNVEMVRTTIHGLEAQKATLSAFQAMQQPVAAAAAAAVSAATTASAATATQTPPAKRRRARTTPRA